MDLAVESWFGEIQISKNCCPVTRARTNELNAAVSFGGVFLTLPFIEKSHFCRNGIGFDEGKECFLAHRMEEDRTSLRLNGKPTGLKRDEAIDPDSSWPSGDFLKLMQALFACHAESIFGLI